MTTETTYYIATDQDANAVHGIGHTADEAIQDACEQSGDPEATNWLIAMPCTQRLYRAVKDGDGSVSWDTVEEDSPSWTYMVEHGICDRYTADLVDDDF